MNEDELQIRPPRFDSGRRLHSQSQETNGFSPQSQATKPTEPLRLGDNPGDIDSGSSAKQNVAICLCTCQRPIMLSRCLESLAAQQIPDDITLSLIVVDNDPGASAGLTVKRFRSDAPFPVHYLFAPKRGIARARNIATDKAIDLGADWIAMIDDDETADGNWIAELMSTSLREFPVVAGLREFVYPSGPSFWEKPRKERPAQFKTDLDTVSTCNVRFSRALLDAGLRFDESLELGGGEDTLFFRQAHAKGFAICQSPRAVTREVRHATRMTYFRIMHRCYAQHAARGYQIRREAGWPRVTIGEMYDAAFHLLAGTSTLAIAPLSILSGPRQFKRLALNGGKHIARFCALVAAWGRHLPQTYRTIHGS